MILTIPDLIKEIELTLNGNPLFINPILNGNKVLILSARHPLDDTKVQLNYTYNQLYSLTDEYRELRGRKKEKRKEREARRIMKEENMVSVVEPSDHGIEIFTQTNYYDVLQDNSTQTDDPYEYDHDETKTIVVDKGSQTSRDVIIQTIYEHHELKTQAQKWKDFVSGKKIPVHTSDGANMRNGILSDKINRLRSNMNQVIFMGLPLPVLQMKMGEAKEKFKQASDQNDEVEVVNCALNLARRSEELANHLLTVNKKAVLNFKEILDESEDLSYHFPAPNDDLRSL